MLDMFQGSVPPTRGLAAIGQTRKPLTRRAGVQYCPPANTAARAARRVEEASLADIQTAGEEGVKVLAPLPKPRSDQIDPHQPKERDEPHVAAWRKRMGTDAAKETYKLRAATSECANGDLRAQRGLQQLPVRGIEKTLTVGLWMAITYNALLWIGATAGGL
jgi:hypothetical protein